jgi:FixJ family two-component response regulator
LEAQRQIEALMEISIVFITGSADVRVAVRAMKAGAVDVLAQPVSLEQLSSAIRAAIDRSLAACAREAVLRHLRDCHALLTPRERDVMRLIVAGLLNKQAAFELGICETTVKAHRGQVMRKMNARSLPDLVRMTARLDIAPPRGAHELM